MDQYRKSNLALWNEWARINSASDSYRLEEFKKGATSLHPLELEEVGSVKGKSLLHMQCHFGMDTLSWARMGAQVTGVDFSDKAIGLAKSLSSELNIPAEFICSDIYDLPQILDRQFDIVFTSYGVLAWLSDLPGWAKIAASFVKPGGFFYIAEFHPFALVFDDESQEPRLRYSYFDREVQAFSVKGSYADREAFCAVKDEYNWPYQLGDIVTSLIQVGLTPQFLHEFPTTVFDQLPFLRENEKHLWFIPKEIPEFPLVFSIKASKTA